MLHLLSCSQIVLCVHRDFEKSWMAGPGVDPNDHTYLYTMSLYFVCTTLSTCGYGDFCATPGDRIEALVILILEFVGMLFYSYTIDRI